MTLSVERDVLLPRQLLIYNKGLRNTVVNRSRN